VVLLPGVISLLRVHGLCAGVVSMQGWSLYRGGLITGVVSLLGVGLSILGWSIILFSIIILICFLSTLIACKLMFDEINK
jgi:hypothetical protein